MAEIPRQDSVTSVDLDHVAPSEPDEMEAQNDQKKGAKNGADKNKDSASSDKKDQSKDSKDKDSKDKDSKNADKTPAGKQKEAASRSAEIEVAPPQRQDTNASELTENSEAPEHTTNDSTAGMYTPVIDGWLDVGAVNDTRMCSRYCCFAEVLFVSMMLRTRTQMHPAPQMITRRTVTTKTKLVITRLRPRVTSMLIRLAGRMLGDQWLMWVSNSRQWCPEAGVRML